MKTLPAPKFLIYAVFRAVRHPRTPIAYYYCSSCKIRFPASARECPKCGDKVESSPDPRQESPVPWWGSVIVICLGIIVVVIGAVWSLPALERLGDYLVGIPLGNLFGLSLQR